MKLKISSCLAILALILLISCSDNNPAGPSVPIDTGSGPFISALSPSNVYSSDTVTITGKRFGTAIDSNFVKINNLVVIKAKYLNWSDTSIVFVIPFSASSGKLTVTVAGKESNSANITIVKYIHPKTPGSWWIHLSYDLDENNNPVHSADINDSTVLTNLSYLYAGQYGSQFDKYYNGGSYKQFDYYIIKPTTLFLMDNYINPGNNMSGVTIPKIFLTGWGKVADSEGSEWVLADSNISNYPISVKGYQGLLNGRYTISCKKGASETVKFGVNESKSVVAVDYQILYHYKGTITITGFPLPLDLEFTITVHRWINSEIGVVREKSPSEDITLPLIGKVTTILGFEKVLLDYKIAE